MFAAAKTPRATLLTSFCSLLPLLLVPPTTSCFFDDRSQWLDPTPACEALLTCAQSVAPESADPLSEQYGADSDCWESDRSASACETQCEASLGTYQVLYPLIEACWVDGTPDASSLFGVVSEAWVWLPETPCVWNWSDLFTTFTGGDGHAFTVRIAWDENTSSSDVWDASGTLQVRSFQLETFEIFDGWKEDVTGSFSEDFESGNLLWRATNLEGAVDESCGFEGVPL